MALLRIEYIVVFLCDGIGRASIMGFFIHRNSLYGKDIIQSNL